MAFAPDGWFTVRDLMSKRVSEVFPEIAEDRRILEVVEKELPSEKALSMRLFRYHNQGLLNRRRSQHHFEYGLTSKGRLRGVMLKKHWKSIHEVLRMGKLIPTQTRPMKIPEAKPITDEFKCGICGRSSTDQNVIVCPHCHKIGPAMRESRISRIIRDLAEA